MDFCLIGIDVGTTATKATLIDAAGAELASFVCPHGTMRNAPGMAEQSPQDWMDGVLGALQQFSDVVEWKRVIGVGLTSQVNSHVFVDDSGAAVRPGIIWQDIRAAQDAAGLERQVSAEQKTAWFGGPVPIDASHALSRMAFVARTEPENWRATRHVLLPKDFVALKLTGAVASDPVAAVGLVDSSGRYVEPLLDLLPGAAARLPPLHPFHHIVGRISAGLPFAGVPVMVGAMDAWAGMFGCGVVGDGEAMYQSGTSEIAGIVSSTVFPTSGVILFPPYQGIRMHAAPTQSGGASLTWLCSLLGRSAEEVLGKTDGLQPDAATPLFLPHLGGERAPIWDATSRGVFARLDANTGPQELTLAVMEGVAHSVRWAFGALQQSAGVKLGAVRISGGGSRSDTWCQIRADVLGLPLARTAIPAAAALGAAIIGGVGSGAFPSLPSAVRQLVRFDREFEPDGARAAFYNERFAHFQALYHDLRPFNERFASR
ncbi:xylulokinase [Devosia submarina]|uniref:xylulokinase n=1 Tax=Devosia submarina TaxID=1173082 RepID=UPI000D38BDE6|nr:FGGY-family carbohydrate kinase [Devosia submarina]